MADGSRQSILPRRAARIEAGQSLRALPPLRRWTLRGAPAVADAIQPAFGVAAPQIACRCTLNADSSRAALWLGPDEWLLLADDPSAVGARGAAAPDDPEEALRRALAALPHSLVDISHRQIALEVSGANSAVLLNSGCPLDLDLSAFPVGMCTRTVLAKAEIILWRTQPDTFHVEVWRSFAAYVSAWLAEAARGLTA